MTPIKSTQLQTQPFKNSISLRIRLTRKTINLRRRMSYPSHIPRDHVEAWHAEILVDLPERLMGHGVDFLTYEIDGRAETVGYKEGAFVWDVCLGGDFYD